MKEPLVIDRDVFITERLGARQSITPEGFLLCDGVRIARTGPMLYAPFEIPDIEPGDQTMVLLDRDGSVLFDPDCMASFNGKPVTNDHPDEMVSPENWRSTAVGVVLNTRQGTGAEAEYLLADLLITDAQAIKDVQAGKREVSCGYESDREQVKPGLGRTTRVVGNHVALVDRGRCGPGCAILDSKENTMAKRSVWDRLRTAFKAKDEAAFEEEIKDAQSEMEDAEGDEDEKEVKDADESEEKKEPVADSAKILDALSGIADAIKGISDRVGKLEDRAAKDAESDEDDKDVKDGEGDDEKDVKDADGDDDKDVKDDAEEKDVKDSVALRDQFTDTLSRAEILAPGIKLPVFDGKARMKSTVDALCDLRRRAMAAALSDSGRKVHVEAVMRGRVLDKMACADVEPAFIAASEIARAANNKSATKDAAPPRQGKMDTAAYAALLADRNKARPK